MLPISWPVSVVLAAILSIIHFGLRIALNNGYFPELFIQTVSDFCWSHSKSIPTKIQFKYKNFSNWFSDYFFCFICIQLIVEVLFLATASISGLYYRIMSDAAHNRTVDGTRTGIQQRVKLECEREQQEQLLLSVIPAYIAAEVCINRLSNNKKHFKA